MQLDVLVTIDALHHALETIKHSIENKNTRKKTEIVPRITCSMNDTPVRTELELGTNLLPIVL